MTDTNELRRLAQAATPGPWYVTGKLTRYVEARIDGGLIQEVAACGPTKADGGYGPQQEANARLIAAANPAAISELLDRLEAAEKERDALRAKITEMEKQEPVEWQSRTRPVWNDRMWTQWSKCSEGYAEDIKKTPLLHDWLYEARALYALPGAQPAPSVPEDVMRDVEWKRELFIIKHAMAMNNWDWKSEASNDMKRAAYAAVVKLLAAIPEAKPCSINRALQMIAEDDV